MKKLTDVLVAKMPKPRSGFRIEWDSATTGLGIKVTAVGRRKFVQQLVFRPPHAIDPHARQLPRDEVLADARGKAVEWYTLSKRGIDPALEELKKSKQRSAPQCFRRSAPLVALRNSTSND